MKSVITFSLLLVMLFNSEAAYSQTKGKTLKDKAHQKDLKEEDFFASDDEKFRVSVYTTEEKSYLGRTHHWFFDLTDTEGKPLNYAKVQLKGHLKSDPSVKFNYIDPVFSLCNEGKYVIGFVRVEQNGPWVLEATVRSKETEDTFSCEIVVADKPG